MKKIILSIFIFIFLLMSCGCDGRKEKMPSNNMIKLEREIKIKNGREIGAFFSEKIDISKRGVELPVYLLHSYQAVKGDDGCCYYFRKEANDNKVIFYRNSGEKVCETTIPLKLKQQGYKISSFVKYKDKIFLELFSSKRIETILTTVHIKNGTWTKKIKFDNYDRIIVYNDFFYCANQDRIVIFDLNGNRKRLVLEREEDVIVQNIIDNRIYYIVFNEDGKNASVMCSDLEGGNKENLFTYQCINGSSGYQNPGSLMFDDEYIYLLETGCQFMLTRIPLYGGEIREIVRTDWFDLSKESIFYMDENEQIYKINKDLTGIPECIFKSNTVWSGTPFFCADEHLLVEGYNKKEHQMIYSIWESEINNRIVNDMDMCYADKYFWVTENGEVEKIIEGSGFLKDWYKLYMQVK